MATADGGRDGRTGGLTMNCREYAKSFGISVVGRLKRMLDKEYGIGGHYPWYMDDAGNEYLMSKEGGKWVCTCIVTAID